MVTKTDTARWADDWAERPVADGGAGLVLVYAPDFQELPPAMVLGAKSLIVGRSPPAGGLCVPHRSVSQLHARLSRRDDRWVLKDMHSRNGTLVNGRVVRECVLEDLDQIRFGDAIFKFVSARASEYLPYPIDAREHADSAIVGGYQIRAALSEVTALATTGLSVVVHGETGTGKELAARALHRASGRRGEFVALNCAAVPLHLFEAELFGFKRGAFTGADRDKVGLMRAAHAGTLFLDEIGDMPLEAQGKLLRAIETREVLALGSLRAEPVDLRIVSATHRDLRALVDEGRFRADLLARLRGAAVLLPALRQRKEDLYALVQHFLLKLGAEERGVSLSFMLNACEYDWPYNVRELEAAVGRAVAIAKGKQLTAEDLPETVRECMRDYGTAPSPVSTPQKKREAPTPDELREMLRRCGGNVAAVARELGRDRAQVHRWMRYANIDPEAFRA